MAWSTSNLLGEGGGISMSIGADGTPEASEDEP